ncbi:MAG: hypothetical protein OXF33_05900 [Rhodospirillales bacterium]|nr:hypothetical protein [Rhodospirillales bacterium]
MMLAAVANLGDHPGPVPPTFGGCVVGSRSSRDGLGYRMATVY